MGKMIPLKNKSPHGWWVATLVERFEFDDEDKSNLKRRCTAWTNTVILKAKNRNDAYRKAIEYGNLGKEDKSTWSQEGTNRTGRWIFEGISSLLPIYEEIDEDGTEIVFKEDTNITVAKVKSWIRKKRELKVFIDS